MPTCAPGACLPQSERADAADAGGSHPITGEGLGGVVGCPAGAEPRRPGAVGAADFFKRLLL